MPNVKQHNLKQHIKRMYADIASDGGYFGDGVDNGPYDPFVVIADARLTPFERVGVSVAVLHRLDSAADNTTWEDVLATDGPRIRKLLATGSLDYEPLVRAAAEAFLASESEFITSLGPVYEQVVKKWAAK